MHFTKDVKLKKLIVLLLLLPFTSTYAKELTSFNAIYDSLSNGRNIKLVIHFDACDPKPPVSNVAVYTTPRAVMLRKNYVTFSNSPLTTNNPAYPNKPILENITYKITNDENLKVVMKTFTLPDYNLVNETSMNCPLKTAVRVYNVIFMG